MPWNIRGCWRGLSICNVVREEIPPETTKFGPLDMHQYQRLFGITRIPSFPYDHLEDCAFPCQSRNILVLIKDQLFTVPVVDGKSGKPLGRKAIYDQLKTCIGTLASKDHIPVPPLAILTSEHRDIWAAVREKLLAAFPEENAKAFSMVNDSIFSVALEEADPKADDSEPAKLSLHGFNGRNRWFDKCITFWISPNAMAGGNGEHSPCDAVIPNHMVQYVLDW
jgi:hypothetical protein